MKYLKIFVKDKLLSIGLITVIAALFLEKVGHIGDIYLLLPMYIAAFLLIGWDIVWQTIKNVSKGDIFDENFLMTIAATGAFILGYYAEAVAVMLFYKVGEFFQHEASENASKAIKSMLELRPETANVLIDGKSVEMSSEKIPVGSLIRVIPGEKISLDGVVVEGHSDVNTAALTGESVPRSVSEGDDVLAGFVNGSGLLTIRTTKEFGQTVFSKVIQLVKESAEQKAKSEKFITRFARYYTPTVVFIAAMVALMPPLFISDATYSTWVYRALIFLVISCPCALVISVPLSFFAGIGAAAKNGVFIKGGQYVDALSRVNTIVFDKTGTLTTGELRLEKIEAFNGYNKEDVLKYGAIAEQYSTHPIGKCIVKAYGKKIEDKYDNYKESAGKGVSVNVGGKAILVGNNRYMSQEGVKLEESTDNVYVAINGEVAGYLVISDTVRENMADILRELREEGVKDIYLFSGDNDKAVSQTVKTLGIDGYKASLLPQDKLFELEKVLSVKKVGTTAFVGDGINDAPALSRADVGIAMGAGSDAALEAADIVLMQNEVVKLPVALKIAHKTRKIAYQNIIGSVGIKMIIMVAGTLGYAALWVAIFADVGVALLAVFNALRILRV